MKIKSQPLISTFPLESDPDGQAEVTVRQAREGENIERIDLFAKTSRVFEQGTGEVLRLEQDLNRRKIQRKEAYLTLAKVTGIVDENGRELFTYRETEDGPSVSAAMTEHEFNKAWNKLPPEVAYEIIQRVYEINPTWDLARQGE